MNTISTMLKPLRTALEAVEALGLADDEYTVGLRAAIAAGEAELKRRQDAIAAVEFWISCSTDKQDAYRALLKLLTEETK
jgi:hypothetical protein